MIEYYKILTPEFRKEINNSIEDNRRQLNTCSENAFVSAERIGLDCLQKLINTLPDGYPIPMERKNDR